MSYEDDGPPLGVRDLLVLSAFVELPKMGEKLSLSTIERFTGIEAKEVFEILTFLEEHECIVMDRNKMQ